MTVSNVFRGEVSASFDDPRDVLCVNTGIRKDVAENDEPEFILPNNLLFGTLQPEGEGKGGGGGVVEKGALKVTALVLE